MYCGVVENKTKFWGVNLLKTLRWKLLMKLSCVWHNVEINYLPVVFSRHAIDRMYYIFKTVYYVPKFLVNFKHKLNSYYFSHFIDGTAVHLSVHNYKNPYNS